MRTLSILALFGLAAVSQAETSYFGLFLQGSKIGYCSYDSAPSKVGNQRATRSDSVSIMDMGMLGQNMKVEMKSTSWSTPAGAPIRMLFSSTSSGRTQIVDASFGAKSVTAKIQNSGRLTTKVLPLPNGPVVDDATNWVLHKDAKPGMSRTMYVLDPTTISFIKNEVKFVGKTQTTVKGKTLPATLVEVVDPNVTMKIFVNDKGDVLRMEGPLGMELLPLSRATAMGKAPKYNPPVDLAVVTSIKTDKPIEDPAGTSELKLRITGRDLKKVPSDEYQTVTRDGAGWVVDIHPAQLSAGKGLSIAEARRQKPDWAKPGLNIPSNTPRFTALAKKIVGNKADVQSAAFAIQKYVYDMMRPNAGIGVLRDAGEVLDTKEGVCRDYAVLTATLLRAAGIPARLASGLVTWDGTFYYHAWVEAWDGKRWIGVDSTTGDNQISASHVKLGEGSVEDAFNFVFLDKAKIEVLDVRHEKDKG